MTVKEAKTLRLGEKVFLTRDDRSWRVRAVQNDGPRSVVVVIRCGDVEMRFESAEALRCIKRA